VKGLKRTFWWSFTAAIAVRLIVAFQTEGYAHPDELFQVIEPAYGMATGWWVPTWEWAAGLRHPLLPALWSILLRACGLLGIPHPFGTARVVFVISGIAASVSVGLAAVLTHALSRRSALGLAVGGLAAIGGPFAYFGVHPLSESLSTPLIMGVLAIAFLRSGTAWAVALGYLATVAFSFRFQSSVLIAPAILAAAVRNSTLRVRPIAVGLALGTLQFAAIDWGYWGAPFRSALEYFRFNIASGGSAFFGVQPWHFAIESISRLVGLIPFSAIVLGWLAFFFAWRKSDWRERILWATCTLFVGLHAAIPHKEDRFMIPVLLPLAITAALCFNRLFALKTLRAAAGALVLALAVSLGLGLYQTNWRYAGRELRETHALGQDPSLGARIILCGMYPSLTGGQFYLANPRPFLIVAEIEPCIEALMQRSASGEVVTLGFFREQRPVFDKLALTQEFRVATQHCRRSSIRQGGETGVRLDCIERGPGH